MRPASVEPRPPSACRRSTPPLKVDATKAYGADVVLYGDVFDESAAHAAELADKEGMIYVPPFDDYEVICGQGTIGLEIA